MFKITSLPVFSEKVNKDEILKEFSMKDIEKGEVLGGGSFGTTFIANFNGKEVALKQLHASNDEVPKFLKEAKIMSCLMNENIVGFEAVCYHPLMLMMELAIFNFNVSGTDKKLTTLENPQLTTLLHYCDSFMFQKIETILPSAATDIVKGLKYLHAKEVVHRDLKPGNVLISNHHYRNLVTTEECNKVFQDKPTICKLCDFGESRSMLKQTKSIACKRKNAVTRGTLAYMTPGDMLLQSASLCDYKMSDMVSGNDTILYVPS